MSDGWIIFRLLVCLLLLNFFSEFVCADDAAARQVTLQDVEGQAISGPLLKLDATTVTLGGPAPRSIPLRDLITLSWPANKLQFHDGDPFVLLSNGDQLGLRLERANDETLTGHWPRYSGWTSLRLPLEAVRGVVVNAPRERDGRSRLVDRLASHTTRSDLLILQNGDSLAGQWLGFADGKFRWKTPAGTSDLDQATIQALCLNPDLVNLPAASKQTGSVLCRLTDGSTLTLKELRLTDAGKLTGHLLSGPELEISLSAISSVSFFGGRATYLADLKPESYRFTPYLSRDWSLRTDRSVQGGPLRLRGVDYAKGLGMHSRSEVTYRLDGRYRRFQATIGIDDDTLGKGSVIFEVLVDGKAAYKSPVLTGTSPAVAIPPVNVAGARTLTLKVDFATLGDIQDHADWCQALLVK